jgi:hypothetical protein
MPSHTILPEPATLQLLYVAADANVITIVVGIAAAEARCLLCGNSSYRIHSGTRGHLSTFHIINEPPISWFQRWHHHELVLTYLTFFDHWEKAFSRQLTGPFIVAALGCDGHSGRRTPARLGHARLLQMLDSSAR